MDMLDGETEVRDYNLERLMMLSDGVFAIAMTLLALELKPPEHWDGHANTLLASSSNSLFAFGLSFASIAIQWAGHRRSFARFKRADFGLSAWNMVCLGLIVLVPAATRAIGESHYDLGVVELYIGLFFALGLANCMLWCHAAFFTDILKPGGSLKLKVTVALMLLLVAPGMTAAGVLTSQSRLRWVGLLIPVMGVIAAYVRAWADKPSTSAAAST